MLLPGHQGIGGRHPYADGVDDVYHYRPLIWAAELAKALARRHVRLGVGREDGIPVLVAGGECYVSRLFRMGEPPIVVTFPIVTYRVHGQDWPATEVACRLYRGDAADVAWLTPNLVATRRPWWRNIWASRQHDFNLAKQYTDPDW